MIGVVLIVPLVVVCLLKIQIVHATSCHFSRRNQASPTGWIDLVDECREDETDAICFSGYNPRAAYFHEAVGWWRVLHSENECLTKTYLRKKLACSDEQKVPEEGCYRDKAYYNNFFLCWCNGSKCNTREKITDIYRRNNTIYAVNGDCKPF